MCAVLATPGNGVSALLAQQVRLPEDARYRCETRINDMWHIRVAAERADVRIVHAAALGPAHNSRRKQHSHVSSDSTVMCRQGHTRKQEKHHRATHQTNNQLTRQQAGSIAVRRAAHPVFVLSHLPVVLSYSPACLTSAAGAAAVHLQQLGVDDCQAFVFANLLTVTSTLYLQDNTTTQVGHGYRLAS
jgi:hypothetical protein